MPDRRTEGKKHRWIRRLFLKEELDVCFDEAKSLGAEKHPMFYWRRNWYAFRSRRHQNIDERR